MENIIDAPGAIPDEKDFSLVLGGPLYQLWRRAGLVDTNMEPQKRRVIVMVVITWLPLLILAAVDGKATPGTVTVPFFYDVMVQARFLIVLPLLVGAELWIHQLVGPAIEIFVERGIVTGKDIPKFRAIVESAGRLRNSWYLEIGLVVMVFLAGNWVWQSQIALEPASWYASPEGSQMHPTAAGYWLAFVSVPIFQFILLRWYSRFLIWLRFLWQVSKLDIHLVPTHPDRAGGIAFLSKCTFAFGPILFAQGTLLAAYIAQQVVYDGKDLMSFKALAVAFVVILVGAVVSPVCVFMPKLIAAKRRGLREYGSFASGYVEKFEKKWVSGVTPAGEELLGSGDIQSLADLGNSFTVVTAMSFVPIGAKDMLRLASITAAPLIPLTLSIFSLEELLTKIIKILT